MAIATLPVKTGLRRVDFAYFLYAEYETDAWKATLFEGQPGDVKWGFAERRVEVEVELPGRPRLRVRARELKRFHTNSSNCVLYVGTQRVCGSPREAFVKTLQWGVYADD